MTTRRRRPGPGRLDLGIVFAGVGLIAVITLIALWQASQDDDPSPSPPVPGEAGPAGAGEGQFTGRTLEGLLVTLSQPAEDDLTVWLDTRAAVGGGAEAAGVIPAGQTVLADPDLGLGPLVDRFDRVVVGEGVEEYALASEPLSEDRIADIRAAVNGVEDYAGGLPALAIAAREIDALVDTAAEMMAAREDDDLGALREAAARARALTRGSRAADPGLIGAAEYPGALDVALAASGSMATGATEAVSAAERIDTAAAACGAAPTVELAGGCIDELARDARELDAGWPEVADAVRGSVVLPLSAR